MPPPRLCYQQAADALRLILTKNHNPNLAESDPSLWSIVHLVPKIHENQRITFGIILFTTKRQTNGGQNSIRLYWLQNDTNRTTNSILTITGSGVAKDYTDLRIRAIETRSNNCTNVNKDQTICQSKVQIYLTNQSIEKYLKTKRYEMVSGFEISRRFICLSVSCWQKILLRNRKVLQP